MSCNPQWSKVPDKDTGFYAVVRSPFLDPSRSPYSSASSSQVYTTSFNKYHFWGQKGEPGQWIVVNMRQESTNNNEQRRYEADLQHLNGVLRLVLDSVNLHGPQPVDGMKRLWRQQVVSLGRKLADSVGELKDLRDVRRKGLGPFFLYPEDQMGF